MSQIASFPMDKFYSLCGKLKVMSDISDSFITTVMQNMNVHFHRPAALKYSFLRDVINYLKYGFLGD